MSQMPQIPQEDDNQDPNKYARDPNPPPPPPKKYQRKSSEDLGIYPRSANEPTISAAPRVEPWFGSHGTIVEQLPSEMGALGGWGGRAAGAFFGGAGAYPGGVAGAGAGGAFGQYLKNMIQGNEWSHDIGSSAGEQALYQGIGMGIPRAASMAPRFLSKMPLGRLLVGASMPSIPPQYMKMLDALIPNAFRGQVEGHRQELRQNQPRSLVSPQTSR